MKNIKDLRDLEDLPVDTLSFKIKKKDQNYYKWNRYGYEGRVGNRGMWSYAGDLITRNIGKSFAMTFSYFCKHTNIFAQYIFLHYFKPYRNKDSDYIIDDNGNIQENVLLKRNKIRNLTYYSDDFKQEWHHKITRAKIEDDSYSRIYRPALYKTCRHKGCDHNNCSHKAEDYELVTVQGWSKTFERWDDPEFKKLRAIDRRKHIDSKRKNLNRNRRKSAPFHVLIEMFTDKREENRKWTERQEEMRLWREKWQQEKARKEYEANLVKIISHGFDPVNSFRHKLK